MGDDFRQIAQKYEKSDLEEKLRQFYLNKCKKTICRDGLTLIFLVMIMLLYRYCDVFNESLWILYRLAFVNVVNPYIVNLARLSSSNCLVENRQYVPPLLECSKASSLANDVVRVDGADLSPLRFEQLNLHEKRVVKVSNALIDDWPIGNLSNSLSSLTRFYGAHDRLNAAFGCELHTNIASEHITTRESLLRNIIEDNPSDWFTVWNHCGETQMKDFRKYYKKPTFLPGYAQMTEPSWLILSQNYRERILLPDVDDKIMLLAQIHGSSRLFLSAHAEASCSFLRQDDTSREKSVSMSRGEMLVVTNSPDVWYDISLLTRQVKQSNDSVQLNVVLVLFADVNYDF